MTTDANTYPVIERILQAIAAACQGILTANGYAVNVTDVVRPRRTGDAFVPKHLGIAILAGEEDENPDYSLIGNPPATAWDRWVSLDLVARVSDANATPMDGVLEEFRSQVIKCLMKDRTFGGLACESRIGPTRYPEGNKAVSGLTLYLIVTYRTDDDDPYVNRV